MSRVSKQRREAYDNIKVGSAISSQERTIAGAASPHGTTYGNTENLTVGNDYGEERHVAGAALIEGERLG